MGNSNAKLTSALHKGKEEEVCSFIKKTGAFDTSKSLGFEHWENTALHYLCWHGMDTAIQQLTVACRSKKKLTPDPSILNSRDETPLHMIFQRGTKPKSREAILRLLLPLSDAGTVNLQDKQGNTALHLAAKTNLMECTHLLLASGADVTILNKKAHTAADEADLARPNGVDSLASELEARVVYSGQSRAGDMRSAIPNLSTPNLSRTVQTLPPTPQLMRVGGGCREGGLQACGSKTYKL